MPTPGERFDRINDAMLPSVKAKAKKPKPVTRSKKPSAKEQIAKTAPECLKLADKLARLALDADGKWGPICDAARAYLRARGL